ncbi:MAG TPA: 4Fe-4S binding protein [Spirochaetota bacterium]|nr:4Fe-4S binding protein [Spirochaetota bacterium]HPI88604.1 4Fe-4S binding protein [Spirochaetota bacterium]HPR48245.1 4Fe-4S binding protein [Spirochaetota bacterium]
MKPDQKNLITLRKITQTISVFLVLFIIWNTRFPLDRFISPAAYFYLDPLVMITTAVAERVVLFGLIVAGILIAATALMGRFFCGWICPLGALLDLLGTLKKPFMRRSYFREKNPGKTRFIKYAILSVILAAAFAGFQFAWVLDPIAIFVRTFSLVIHPLLNNGLNAFFTGLLSSYDLPVLENVYNLLRDSFLTTDLAALENTTEIILLFSVIVLLLLFKRRFWCRYLCPLGAMLAVPARLSPFLRRTRCVKNCRVCMHTCRMNAITADNRYHREECILCFDCVRDCPDSTTYFSFTSPPAENIEPENADKDPSLSLYRNGFLRCSFSLGIGLVFLLTMHGKALAAALKPVSRKLRPPGSLPENEFIQRCIRCGNCMKVCPTGVLKPAPVSMGPDKLWTPFLDTSRSYCEYNCNLCGRVCPTGAIEKLALDRKKKKVIGVAVINKDLCVPYKKGIDCIVCEEHCPVSEKAIIVTEKKIKGKKVRLPQVQKKLCIGCGICEIKCPVEKEKAIKVFPPDYKPGNEHRNNFDEASAG